MSDVLIEAGCYVGVGALLPAGGKLLVGVPAVLAKDLPPDMSRALWEATRAYQELPSRCHKKSLSRIV